MIHDIIYRTSSNTFEDGLGEKSLEVESICSRALTMIRTRICRKLLHLRNTITITIAVDDDADVTQLNS